MRLVKQVVKRLAPGLFHSAKDRYKWLQFRFGHGGSEYRAKRSLVRRYGKVVLSGPFRGMRYGDDVVCSAYVAKLLGSYEQELHDGIEQLLRSGYRTVVDVGAAEGYYAVGFALRLPEAQIHAFDTDVDAQRYCARLARLNERSDRVHVHGICDDPALQPLVGPNTLVICDCEGFEAELLDPARVPGLYETDMLVELHEFLRPGVTDQILRRFEGSHTAKLIDTAERNPDAYPALAELSREDRYCAVREGRPAAMQWAVLIAIAGAAGHAA